MLRRVTGGGAIAPFVGAYGKLPRIGDFVAVHAEKTLGFQDWVGRAIDWADRQKVVGWPQELEGRPGAAFTYRPAAGGKKHEGILAGAFWASRDAVGRRYPFMIFSSIPDEIARGAPHLLPIAMDSFVQQALSMQEVFVGASSGQEVEALLAALQPITMVEATVRAYYEAYVAGAFVQETWASLYGNADGEGARYAIQMIRETLVPFQTVEDARTEIGVRLPLGPQPAYETAFWLDLIQRVGRMARPVPTSIHYPRPGVPGRGLFVALGDPHPSALAEATVGTGDTDLVCDLTVAMPDRGSVSRLPVLASHLEASIQRENATLAHVLDALG